MLYELKHIVDKAIDFQNQGISSVMATVVALDGSSYRKPGVRMLIAEDGEMIGAVSGGCVEREVYEQSKSVFRDGLPKVMTYDGRYRLGCEGILHILIEPLQITKSFYEAFYACLRARYPVQITSYFAKQEAISEKYGTVVYFDDEEAFSLRKDYTLHQHQDLQSFNQNLAPRFRLYICGGEHDGVKLCAMASSLGWEVHVITSIRDPKTAADFPGASSVIAQAPELAELTIDDDTAVVLMTHNYAQDLKWLLRLEAFNPRYIGILGSGKRQEKLVDEVLNQKPDFNISMLDQIYSPAGLHIGSVTPEEIGLSILAEILAVYRGLETASLRDQGRKSVEE